MKRNAGKERLCASLQRAIIGGTFSLGIAGVFLHHVMVSVEHVEAVRLIKLRKLTKDIAMNFFDLFNATIFPKFVAIAKFDIGKPAAVIVV